MELEGEIKRGAALREIFDSCSCWFDRSSSGDQPYSIEVVAGQIGDCHPNVYKSPRPFGVPFLLLLGCTTWVKTTREKLSIWRNGLSLSSIVLLSCAWTIDLAERMAETDPIKVTSSTWIGWQPSCTQL